MAIFTRYFVSMLFTFCIHRIDRIVEGIKELITDTSKAGAVLRATPRGLTYQQYPEDRAAKL